MIASCRACGDTRFWRVFPMHERGAPMAVAYEPIAHVPLGPETKNGRGKSAAPTVLRPTRAHGRYETRICAECGATTWYAREFAPDQLINLGEIDDEPPVRSCLDCGGERLWFVARVFELNGAGNPVVRGDTIAFYLFVCKSCERTHWRWRPSTLKQLQTSKITGHCRECGSAALRRLLAPLEARFGNLDADLCLQCPAVMWTKADVKALRADSSMGVSYEQADEVPSGPYR